MKSKDFETLKTNIIQCLAHGYGSKNYLESPAQDYTLTVTLSEPGGIFS